jgi:LemA protein
MKLVSISLLIVVAVGVGVALVVYSSYSSLLASDRKMVVAYKEYDAALRRQRDMVPDLVEVVRKVTLVDYPEYEQLEAATERVDSVSRIAEGVVVQNKYTHMLDRVISVADSYPQLRVGQDYAMIMDQFRAAEGRAYAERAAFNRAAEEFNEKLEQFPGNVVSQVFDVPSRPLLNSPTRLHVSS